ncbi:penicillin-binding protein [Streptomyces sp. NBRC 110611]|nr:penicillin-binding protein [Streptomyces sp. NBRC 110611]
MDEPGERPNGKEQMTPERGLFWHPAPGTDPAADNIWVHYGFTGTGMWISPAKGRWAVLLTNKLYYTRDREPLTAVRNAFRTAAVL